jgi:hypothetical protein
MPAESEPGMSQDGRRWIYGAHRKVQENNRWSIFCRFQEQHDAGVLGNIYLVRICSESNQKPAEDLSFSSQQEFHSHWKICQLPQFWREHGLAIPVLALIKVCVLIFSKFLITVCINSTFRKIMLHQAECYL